MRAADVEAFARSHVRPSIGPDTAGRSRWGRYRYTPFRYSTAAIPRTQGSNQISTRRFLDWPAGVSLQATGAR